jgi:hypothetical protein
MCALKFVTFGTRFPMRDESDEETSPAEVAPRHGGSAKGG